MQLVLGILGFIFIFGLAVLFHELGHFLTARKYGVLCHEFAIGMGPIVWKTRKGETLYTLRAIPIGGFVSMGMDEGERDIVKEGAEIGLTLDGDGNVTKIHIQPAEGQIAGTLISNTFDISADLQLMLEVAGERKVYAVDREAWYIDTKDSREARIVPSDRRLENKPKRQRFVIMVAGAVMNFVLAYLLALIIGIMHGEVIGTQIDLGHVVPGGPAYEAGIVAGDIMIEMNGLAIAEPRHVIEAVRGSEGSEILVIFQRDGQVKETYVTPILQDGNYMIEVSHIGVQEIIGERSFMGIFRSANARWMEGAMIIVTSLGMLATGEAGAGDLAGVVGIVHMTSEVAMMGFVPLLMFAVIININLGIFNLLPFPALDGGHITFIVIEAIIGKPVNTKIQHVVSLIGFGLLMALMLFTVFNDVLRLVR